MGVQDGHEASVTEQLVAWPIDKRFSIFGNQQGLKAQPLLEHLPV
jgi:hypothetical protein